MLAIQVYIQGSSIFAQSWREDEPLALLWGPDFSGELLWSVTGVNVKLAVDSQQILYL